MIASKELTAKERAVLELAALGMTNKQIAKARRCSPATIKTMIGRAFNRLGERNRTAAVAKAIRAGII